MERINAAICDDDKAFREMLEAQLKDYALTNDIDMNIVSFSNGLEIMISETKYDLILMDYRMSIMNGVETAKKLRGKGVYCPIIFVTGYDDAENDATQVNAFRFIKKPVEPELFSKAMNDFMDSFRSRRIITFEVGKDTVSLSTEEILCVEGKLFKSVIHTFDASYTVKQKFSAIAEVLPGNIFFPCGQKLTVNTKCIRNIGETTVELLNGYVITTDRSKLTQLKNHCKQKETITQ